MSAAPTRADLVALIERREDELYYLQRMTAVLRDEAAEAGSGLGALNLERALVALSAAGRALRRARMEVER